MTTLDYSYERRIELTFEEGVAEGKARGISQGIELLSTAITELKSGKSAEQLIEAGISEDIIDKAMALLG